MTRTASPSPVVFDKTATVDTAILRITATADGLVSGTLRNKEDVLLAHAENAWCDRSNPKGLASTLLAEFVETLSARGVSGFRACGWSCGCRRDEDEYVDEAFDTEYR